MDILQKIKESELYQDTADSEILQAMRHSGNLGVVIDMLVLTVAAGSAMVGNIGMAIVGIVVYLIGQRLLAFKKGADKGGADD